MRKLKFLGLFLFIFIFSILIVSCGGKKKSEDNSSDTTQDNSSQIVEDKYYNVEFKNYNGDLLLSTKVKDGATPKYSGDEPVKPDTETSYYTFKGWNPELSAVSSDMTYTAQFERHDCVNYTITFKNSDGSVLQSGYVREGSMPSFNGTPTKANDDDYYYTFSGWTPALASATENAEYTANYERHDLPYTITIDLDGGSSVTLEKDVFKTDKLTADMLVFDVNKSGFAFRGYTIDDVLVFDEYGNQEVSNINLTPNTTIKAKYDTNVKLNIKYSLYNPFTHEMVEESVGKPYYAEDVSVTDTYECNTTVDLFANPTDEYTFIGWYYNGIVLSTTENYNYMMWEKDLTLEARFEIKPYMLTLNVNKSNLGSVEIITKDEVEYATVDYQMYLAGDSATISAFSLGETRFLGWYEITDDGDIFVSPNAVYSFTMPKKNYTLEARWEVISLTTKSNNTDYGVVSTVYNERELEVGTKVNLSCSAKTGYIFEGWYEGNTLVSDNLSFQYTMPSRAVKLVATFRGVTVTLINDANVSVNGFVSGLVHKTNESITLNATNNTGMKLVWYLDGIANYVGNSYTFTTKTEDIIVRVIKTSSFESIAYTRENNTIYFGTYPQTLVDENTKSELDKSYATTLPTSGNANGWIDYQYYKSGSVSSFMWYKDVDEDNDGQYDYRGVYFTDLRPAYYYDAAAEAKSYVDDNGYSVNTVYWFSYDLIEWTILKEENGKAFIVANLALDSREEQAVNGYNGTYDHNGGTGYANNYALSNIRIWLNNSFYNTFSEFEKLLINTTLVDNSKETTADTTANNKACENTEDNIFLLSYLEATTYLKTNNSRIAYPTDYAKCQGIYINSNHCPWMLRSPYKNDGYHVLYVGYSGLYGSNYCYKTGDTNLGIRPACWIEL